MRVELDWINVSEKCNKGRGTVPEDCLVIMGQLRDMILRAVQI
jgi:hypothetical protein